MPRPDPGAAERLAVLVAAHPQLSVRKVFGFPAAFANGNMCVGTFGSDIFVRLNAADQRIAESLPGARRFAPMPGREMRGYVVLPGTVLVNEEEAARWVARSVEFALSLPAKGPKRPGAKG